MGSLFVTTTIQQFVTTTIWSHLVVVSVQLPAPNRPVSAPTESEGQTSISLFHETPLMVQEVPGERRLGISIERVPGVHSAVHRPKRDVDVQCMIYCFN